MLSRRDNHRELFAGGLFVGIGGAWAALSLQYDLGEATRMGPGYFPLCAALVLIGIGAILLLRGWRGTEPTRLHPIRLVPLFFVIAATASFGLLIERVGLIPSALVVTALSCYDRWRTRPLEAAALCVAYTVAAVGIFYYGLQLPMDLY